MPSGATYDEAIRVIIADDHPVVRDGLNSILGPEPGISVIGQAEDSVEAEKLDLRSNPSKRIAFRYPSP